jgi:hypothetical protein
MNSEWQNDRNPTTRSRGRFEFQFPSFCQSLFFCLLAHQAHAVPTQGEVAILEGDSTLVTAEAPSGFGIELATNPQAIVSRYASEVVDAPAILAVFTSFPDLGTGDPAYFLPIWNDTQGTGMGAVDLRASFGTASFEGFIDLKAFDGWSMATLLAQASHEIAHRHLAYMSVEPVGSSSTAVPILGRDRAHWRASLHTFGSLMEGYAWSEDVPGHFVVTGLHQRFSTLDLYGLGLIDPAEVAPFFVIQDATLPGGTPLPISAQLSIGSSVTGTRIDLGIEDVVRALGPRRPSRAPSATRVLFVLVTEPGQSAEAPEVVSLAARIDAFRPLLEDAYSSYAGGRGTLCTAIRGCGSDDGGVDAGMPDAGPIVQHQGCRCSDSKAPAGDGAYSIAVAVLIGALLRRRRRERSCGRSPWSASLPSRSACRPLRSTRRADRSRS